MIMSMLFKTINKFDIAFLVILFAIMVFGIANFITPYQLLQVVLLLLIIVLVYLQTKTPLTERVAFIALCIGITVFIIIVVNIFGYYFFIYLMDILFYFIYLVTISLFIISYQEIEN